MPDDSNEIFRGIPQRRRPPQTFRLGDMVRIRSGPFAAFTGRIEGINHAKRLLKVEVEIFGRVMPIKLGYADVEMISFS